MKITGYAAVYNTCDDADDIIRPYAIDDLEKPIPLLWQHETQIPFGEVKVGKRDKTGFFIEAETFDFLENADKEALIINKVVTGLSIGYGAVNVTYGERPRIRFIHKLRLLEVSVVTFPAHHDARIKVAECRCSPQEACPACYK